MFCDVTGQVMAKEAQAAAGSEAPGHPSMQLAGWRPHPRIWGNTRFLPAAYRAYSEKLKPTVYLIITTTMHSNHEYVVGDRRRYG